MLLLSVQVQRYLVQTEMLEIERVCHGRSYGPTFSVAEHPVFYNFATLWAFIAPTSSRFVVVQLCYGTAELA